ncbi:hypothetical protein [Herpetosiphon geysericola]|uniref:hypothetical protein n=1 Tax=Herpetosiphon geysericola TaxID=70996 RepID=UPI00128E9DEC|nr:hypothetical protein [Herpetosiphon geysericola]
MSNLIRTLVHVPKDDLNAMALIAKQMQVSRAVVVRWAISSYLQKNLPNCPDEGTKVSQDEQDRKLNQQAA